MRRTSLNKVYFFLIILSFSITIFSCSTTKKVAYFQDIPDSGAFKTIPKVDYTEPIIGIGDMLNIPIQTIDPLATTLVNSGSTPSGGASSAASSSSLLASLSGGSQLQTTGYLVDKEGNIEIPIIGKLKAAGYTTFQLRGIIYDLALKYFKDPTITVRFANFKVSVIGEVLKPGQYIMPDERESIFDAIAMAGDLTVFGRRENVLLIRQNIDGTKSTYRIDLKKSESLSASIYYVHQNDIIYVEPRKAKSDATDASQAKYITIAGSILSVLIILATRVSF